MGIEIEKKFLVSNDEWRSSIVKSVPFRQGYLTASEKSSVRLRVEGDIANINIKSGTLGITRQEYEYDIPLDDANTMLTTLCEGPLIEKTRHYIFYGEHEWEVDEFHGENEGLIVAEIELRDENEVFKKPIWLGQEVSHDKRYYNSLLVHMPYKRWK